MVTARYRCWRVEEKRFTVMNKTTIQLADNLHCTGCGVCSAVCPQAATKWVEDELGFAYPAIDESRCINCGRCAKSCPVLHKPPTQNETADAPCHVYAVKANDDLLRLKSSSGGVFSLMAEETLRNGGVVFGVVWDAVSGKAVYAQTTDSNGIASMRGSKYVQAFAGAIYGRVKERIVEGRDVLFTGTPCQIAGLLAFLGCKPKRLLLAEVICMGCLSSKTLALAGEECGWNGHGEVVFRNKDNGWNAGCCARSTARVQYVDENGNSTKSAVFYRAMMSHLWQRESCYRCAAKEGGGSGADVTLGDFWNVHRSMPDFDDDKGVSLVVVHTESGRTMWKKIVGDTIWRESNMETALKVNPSMCESLSRPPNRSNTVELVKAGMSVRNICAKLDPRPTLFKRMEGKLKRMVRL